MLAILLTIFAAVSAVFCIRARLKGPKIVHYIFKPLTMILIILIPLQQSSPVSQFYKYMIIAALIFSLAGDIFLMLPKDRFVLALLNFLVGHLFYITAFLFEGGHSSSLLYLLPFLLYGAIMLSILLPYLGKMKLPVLVYMLVLMIMAWQALNRWIGAEQPGSLTAFVGALFFISSDSILAIDRFREKFDSAHGYILSTYFIAQWLIALSV